MRGGKPMIDIHCHILPGIDDGSKDLDSSLQMINTAINAGTKKFIVTPHFYWGQYENDYLSVTKHLEKLNAEILKRQMPIELYPGQEIFVDRHTLGFIKEGAIRGLNDSKYLLIEFPMDALPKDAFDVIYELKILGFKPILAHPERYRYVIENPSEINKFINEGCLIQINAGSITGLFGSKIEQTALTLIEHNVCQFIASDAHSTGKRNTDLTEVLTLMKKSYGRLYEKILVNGQNVIDNKEISTNMRFIQEKKGFFSRMFGK